MSIMWFFSVESISVILVSEIGDKTFFIAAILAMQGSELYALYRIYTHCTDKILRQKRTDPDVGDSILKEQSYCTRSDLPQSCMV
jgi:hypothetical protein